MRVAIISKTFVAETAQRQLEWLARQPGIEVTLITPHSWRTDDGGVMPFHPTFTEGYQVRTLPVRANGAYHFYHYVGLRQALSELAPDILHIDEEPYNPATTQALRCARQMHIPALVVTWQNRYRRYPPPFNWMERWVYRYATAMIAGNAGAAEVVNRKGYHGPLAIFSLHGVDPTLWLPRLCEPPTPDVPFTIGYVGRLVPEKGIDLLITALAQLPDRYQLRIIGRGPLADELHHLANSMGVAKRIEWYDHLPSLAMPDEMRSLDVLTLPSRTRPQWSEQFGRVLIEAMITGVPVIGSSSGEIPSVIGDSGLIFPEDDAKALATTIDSLAHDAECWRDYAQRGRARALTNFTQEAIAQRLTSLYATIEKRHH